MWPPGQEGCLGEDGCMYVYGQSLCRSPGTITTLLTGYMAIHMRSLKEIDILGTGMPSFRPSRIFLVSIPGSTEFLVGPSYREPAQASSSYQAWLVVSVSSSRAHFFFFLIHSSDNGLWGCFHSGADINNAALNIRT